MVLYQGYFPNFDDCAIFICYLLIFRKYMLKCLRLKGQYVFHFQINPKNYRYRKRMINVIKF